MLQAEPVLPTDRSLAKSPTAIAIYEGPRPPHAIERVVDHLSEIKPPDWLVRSLIETQTIGTIFGETNVGKSALAVDIACRVAGGLTFAGQRTRAGAVLYVAQEGRGPLKRRFRAWELHNNHKLDRSIYQASIDVRIPDEGVEEQLTESVEWLNTEHGSLALVVMDTASTTMVGDQKHGADMNAFLAGIRRLFPESAVMLIHHPGHGDKSRGRGASELPAACDWEFKLERVDAIDKVVRLRNTKQRDAALHPDITFQLFAEILGVDEEGEDFESVVAEYLPDYKALVSNGKTSPTQTQMLNVLNMLAECQSSQALSRHDIVKVSTDDWIYECCKRGIKKDTARKCKSRLLETNRIQINGIYVSTRDAGQTDTP